MPTPCRVANGTHSFKYFSTASHYNSPRERKESRNREEAMESFSSETESPVFLAKRRTTTTKKKKKSQKEQRRGVEESWPKKKGGGGVTLEGYLEATDGSSDRGSDSSGDLVGRTKSLTDEDLDELKGCLDLGFGFSYDEIPELCSTLPALELCYSMSQRFLDDHHHHQQRSPTDSTGDAPAAPVANWRFSSPGDDPEEVKARLKYWAQAVACTVRLCS